MGYMDSLINNQVIYFPCVWVIISDNTAHGLIGLSAEGWVTANNLYWSDIFNYNQGILPKPTGVCVQVKFKCSLIIVV